MKCGAPTRRPTAGRSVADDDSQPVMVPRSDKMLVPTSPERVRRLREHVAEALLASDAVQDPKPSSSPLWPEPEGFTDRVARTACSMCRGWCCRNGDDDAFLDEATMARVRSEMPESDAQAAVRLYVERVPEEGYEGSCIFHAKQGCTLDRSLRSDVCNSYFCGGLHDFVRGANAPAPVVVIAGEGNRMRTSPVLLP
jgi:hypothetical protein